MLYTGTTRLILKRYGRELDGNKLDERVTLYRMLHWQYQVEFEAVLARKLNHKRLDEIVIIYLMLHWRCLFDLKEPQAGTGSQRIDSVQCCLMSTETVRTVTDGQLDFHTAPEL